MSNNRQRMVQQYGFSARSRREEFGTGAASVQQHVDGSVSQRSAIEAAGGDPSKYVGGGWDAAAIREVEHERYLKSRE